MIYRQSKTKFHSSPSENLRKVIQFCDWVLPSTFSEQQFYKPYKTECVQVGWWFDQKLKWLLGILPSAGPTSTERSAWQWQTRDAFWFTSSPSPSSPSPSTFPSSWRSPWPNTMEPTKWMLRRPGRIQPSFSGEIYIHILIRSNL